MEHKRKKIRLIIQEKGGVGKSHLTYFLAVKYEKNERVFFIDADSGNSSSSQQIKFVSKRLAKADFLTAKKQIDRFKFITTFQMYVENIDADVFIFDMGAPESQQFPILFTDELATTEQLISILNKFNAELELDVVISVGIAYGASVKYLNNIVKIFNGHADICVFVNENEKYSQPENYKQLIDILLPQYISENKIKKFYRYGVIETATVPGFRILERIKDGLGIDSYKDDYMSELYLSFELNAIE